MLLWNFIKTTYIKYLCYLQAAILDTSNYILFATSVFSKYTSSYAREKYAQLEFRFPRKVSHVKSYKI